MTTACKNYEQEIKLHDLSIGQLPSIMGAQETIDSWRHERMYDTVRALIASRPDAEWLTIGDNGADGWMLRQLGAKTVTASSISDARLQKLGDMGRLEGIRIRPINAESIDLPDQSVDFIFCKEAFHHFPRAPLAFYEFLRVARTGFVLIEPREPTKSKPLDVLRSVAKRVLRRRSALYEQFEPVGNYIYRVSEREVFRMLSAIQIPWFAVKSFSDFSTVWLSKQRRSDLLPRFVFHLGIEVQNQMARLGLMNPGLCAIFVPTSPEVADIKDALVSSGFMISNTPRNPYTSSDYSKKFLS
jgi:SAM-dependent methyltransferase